MNDELVIHIRDLQKSFRRHRVLRGVSFDVPRGQTLALLGATAPERRPSFARCSDCSPRMPGRFDWQD